MARRASPVSKDPSPLKAFGVRVRQLRTARGWSQMELGQRADRHFTFVSGIEGGQHNVSLMTIRLLAQALGVDPAILVTDDEAAFRSALGESKKN